MDRIERTVRRIRALPGLRQLDKWRYKKIFARHCAANLFSGVYDTFAAAQKDIPPTKPQGYDHEAAALMYGKDDRGLQLVDYPIAYWLNSLVGESTNLFDYGGHIGLRFYGSSRYLDFPPGFTWTIWDVPTVVQVGHDLARSRSVSGLEFTTDLSLAEKANIFFAGGSLQYFEERFPDTLQRLQIRPRHILINELPLHHQYEFVTINNMTTAYCTYKVFHKQTFLDHMEAAGYKLVDIWKNSRLKNCDIPFHEGHQGALYYGMYYRDTKS